MNKILQRVIMFAVGISIAIMAAAATVPNVLSQLPYAYGLGNFPAYQINQNEAFTLSYVDAITPQTWQIVTASGVAALGGNYAVNTTSAAITMTLPAVPTVASPLYSMKFLDAANKFNTNNLTISASGVANINGLSGASAVVTASTQGGEVECTWLNSTIGYNCNAR
jgi:hypothetical protein